MVCAGAKPHRRDVAATTSIWSFQAKTCMIVPTLYMQSVFIMQCSICKVSLLYSALYAKFPCYTVLHMQSVLVMQCFMCKASDHTIAQYEALPEQSKNSLNAKISFRKGLLVLGCTRQGSVHTCLHAWEQTSRRRLRSCDAQGRGEEYTRGAHKCTPAEGRAGQAAATVSLCL